MFANNSYMKVWAIEKSKSGNYYEVEMSSRKKKENGEYETDFSTKYARFVGEAKNKITDIDEGSTIIIKNCGVTTYYDKESKRGYTHFIVFDFDVPDGNNKPSATKEEKKSKTKSAKPAASVDVDDDDDLPF